MSGEQPNQTILPNTEEEKVVGLVLKASALSFPMRSGAVFIQPQEKEKDHVK